MIPSSGPVVAFLGDDFTGSAAVAEVLHFAGLPTVLFLGPPEPAISARFSHYRCFGLATDARTRDPAWMDANLPGLFSALMAFGAPILHYKICSTLDSSAHLGSIGRAAEIGLAQTGCAWAPLVTASPRIGRWQVFGNLFARAPGEVARLDRHPTMSVHPTTPMDEADVRIHVARQTALRLGLVDVLDLRAGNGADGLRRARAADAQIVAFDLMDEASLIETGRTIWNETRTAPVFALGSQGLEDALVAAWVASGHRPHDPPRAGPASRLAVVSGSCSPDTARQIAEAERQGFEAIRLDAALAVDPVAWRAECARAMDLAVNALGQGRNPLVHTARGPDDAALARTSAAIASSGRSASEVLARIGAGLGSILAALADHPCRPRLAVAGGDTSSIALAKLGLVALTPEAFVAPAIPLLAGHRTDPGVRPLEVVLKGGQMGAPDLFSRLRDGR